MTRTQTRLLLVRHGETPWNAEGRWQGHGDPGLTPEGQAQAQRLARSLAAADPAHARVRSEVAEVAARPSQTTWTRILSSDLARARETAVAVADLLGLPIEFDQRLRELDVGAWSGLTREEIAARDPETLRRFERGEPFVRPGDGESRVEIRERTHAFVSGLARRCAGDRVIVVTHLGVIRSLVPGANPGNASHVEVIAEDLAARPIDRTRRPEDGAL